MSSRLIVSTGLLLLTCLNAPAFSQATQPGMGEYRPTGGYPETYRGTFYPGTELRALPVARAQAAAAAAEVRRAESTLNVAVLDIRRAFYRSPELREAIAEEQAAYESLKAIREQTLKELKSDETYQTMSALRDRLKNQIDHVRAESHPALDRLLALATVKLSYSATVTTIEAAAISSAPQTASARQRLVRAGQRITELREQYEDAVRNSPEVQIARKALADARVAAIATNALYLEAAKVANVAMDYAYHIYDQPYPYVINTPYYGGGYGGVGYPIGYPVVGYPIGHPWGGQQNHPRR